MATKEITVLIVDDDMINLKLLKSMLMKHEIVKEIVEAKDGAEAIDIIKSRDDIDLILLDIIMPIMGGLEMLKIVRADDSIHQLPIIMLTTDDTKRSEALEYGANDFLTKPVRAGELIEKILAVLL